VVTAPSKVLEHFRVAFAYRIPFTAMHVAVRLVTSALFVPLIGLLLGTVVGFTGRSAVTDQAIAPLLLTPAGAFTMLAAISLGISAAVLDVTVMMHTLATRETRMLPAIRRRTAFVVLRFARVLRFSLGLFLRVRGIALPFVLAMAAIAYWSLRDYDINYYLTYHPPQALLAAAMIAVLATFMDLILLSQPTGWAFALQLAVGARHATTSASQGRFALSVPNGQAGRYWPNVGQNRNDFD
jgi:glycerophosphoryl diester phosphodiesterase